ncbi:ATP-binding protein [Undibacterium sp. Ji50W]|uniref:ATP-binding protein n=1 Tax=Undibacterium sp. Ji50W TaxID=3413041 RepID=UPI003BEF759F
MDGIKKRIENSIQVRLSVWLAVAICGVALIAGVFAFFSALDEVNELQDDMLRQIAALSEHQNWAEVTDTEAGKNANDGVDGDSRVFVQLLPVAARSGAIAAITVKSPLPLPGTLQDGMQTFNNGQETYRVLVHTLSMGKRLAVAQEMSVRDEIANNSALRTLMPFLLLMPILLLMVANIVHSIFKPVASLSVEINRRDEQALHPISCETLPREIRPFVVAINHLLTRVEQFMGTQRRFVADAAHELRSPLTALSLQAELLANTDMSVNARERLQVLRQGIERGKTLLAQLLTLARVQTTTSTSDTGVSVQKIYRRVLEEVMLLADAKQLDIGVVGDQDADIMVNELDLIILIRNLVDNAIRYTPNGGRVDLSVASTDAAITLTVEDNGPGIAVADRERVFDPFYRVLGNDQLGSGLGLAIVHAISTRIGAGVQLDFSDERLASGLRVSVTFAVR